MTLPWSNNGYGKEIGQDKENWLSQVVCREGESEQQRRNKKQGVKTQTLKGSWNTKGHGF